jgi:hypothetical protein
MWNTSSVVRTGALTSLGILCLAITSPAHAQTGGKAPAIPKFQIQYWHVPGSVGNFSYTNVNNYGQIAGNYTDTNGQARAFLYKPQVNLTTAMDVEAMTANAGVPAGWRISGAVGINDHGVLLGTLTRKDPDTGVVTQWPYRLDTLAQSPAVVPLPNLPGVSEAFTVAINNDGDILCRYGGTPGSRSVFVFNPATQTVPYFLDKIVTNVHLGNSTTAGSAIVGGRYADGSLFRWVPATNMVANIGVSMVPFGMNDQGVMAGQYNGFAARLITAPPRTFSVSPVAWDVNNSNDLAISRGYLYRDDVGYVTIKNYLSGSTADLALWSAASTDLTYCLNERQSATGFSQIAGYLSFTDGSRQPYLLTPIAKPRR